MNALKDTDPEQGSEPINKGNEAAKNMNDLRNFCLQTVQHSLNPHYLVNPDNTIIIWNHACEELFGIPAGEAVGNDFTRLLNIEDKGFDSALSEALGGRPSKSNELKVSVNNRTIYLSTKIYPITSDSGEVYALALENNNITDTIRIQELYNSLIGKSALGLLIYRDNDVLFANSRFAEMLGMSQEKIESLGVKELFTFVHPDDQAYALEEYNAILGEKDPAPEFAFRFVRKDEGIVWTAVKLTNILYFGEPAVRAMLIDITKRKTAEEALRLSEAKFKIAFDSNPEPMIISSLGTGLIIDINKSLTIISGYTRDDLVGKESLETGIWINTEDYNRYRKVFTTHGTADNFKTKLKTKNGQILDSIVSGKPVNIGGKPCLLSVFRKNPDTKLVEKELNEFQSRFTTLFEQAPEPIFILSLEGSHLSANRRACRLFDYSYGELIKLRLYDIVAPEFQSNARHMLSDIFGLNEIPPTEMAMVAKSGKKIPVEISASLIRDVNNNPVYIQAIARDISERVISEKTTRALYSISRAATSDIRLAELYRRIHDALGTIIDATNFVIALYDEEKDLITISYAQDEKNSVPSMFSRCDIKSKTAHVITHGQSLFVAGDDLKRRIKTGEFDKTGPIPKVWLGVPLRVHQTIIGAMAVFSYTDADKYSEKEFSLMKFVSEQVAAAIESKRKEEELRASREKIARLQLQTEQFSLAAASIITEKDLKLLFERIAKTIVEHSDYRRVLISYFKDTPPYRDIIGYGGISDRDIEKIRPVNLPKDTFLNLFENGSKVGCFSYFIPHNLHHLLSEAAVIRGCGPEPDSNDKWHPLDSLFVPMIDDEGTMTGVISVDDPKSGDVPSDETVRPIEIFSSLISQIIIQKKSTEKVRNLEQQLYHAQKMESIGRLAGGIAHDFNNILTSIMGWAELLKAKYTEDHEDFQAVSTIYNSTERASDLTRQLLGLARKGKRNFVTLNVNDIIKDVVSISEKIFEKNISVEFDFDPDIKNIEADKNQISQVLTNLLINAKDAMPNGGSIYFETENIHVDINQSELFSEYTSGEYVKISVTDTGIGMSKEVQEHIFEPFYTTKGKGAGTGLGLASVYGIIKNHQGNVTVRSEPGIGSTFTIILPVSAIKTEPAPVKKPEISTGTATILVVEDEKDVSSLECSMLQSLGYTTLTAINGLKAVKLYGDKYREIDLIMLDLIMPVMSGFDAFDELMKINPNAKIIIVSGFSQEEKMNKLIEKGALKFIQKPFKVREISSAVAEALGA